MLLISTAALCTFPNANHGSVASATGSLPAGPAQSGGVGPLGSELTVLPYLATILEFGKTTFAFHP